MPIGPDRLARFEREAQLLASLNHPHNAAIHGFEEGPAAAFTADADLLIVTRDRVFRKYGVDVIW